MNSEKARYNMVLQQIQTTEVLDEELRTLLFSVKREAFVPEAYRDLAFADVEIPLMSNSIASTENSATPAMLAPKVEAKIIKALKLKASDSVLEVGTGSGYLTALLAARSDEVYSVEIVPELAIKARDNLYNQGVSNVEVETGDAAQGWPSYAPYDAIVMSGSMPVLPKALLAQLKVGGRLFAIVGVAPAMEARLITCTAHGQYRTITLFETSVAPLVNAQQPEHFDF